MNFAFLWVIWNQPHSQAATQLFSLTEQKNWGRPGIIYHVSDVRVERRVERMWVN